MLLNQKQALAPNPTKDIYLTLNVRESPIHMLNIMCVSKSLQGQGLRIVLVIGNLGIHLILKDLTVSK